MFLIELTTAAVIALALVLVGRRTWLRLATRNWTLRPVRTIGAILAIALGTGAVVWVTCSYESVRRTVVEWSREYIGESHIGIQSAFGKYDAFSQRYVTKIERLDGVKAVAPALVQVVAARTLTAQAYAQDSEHLERLAPTMNDLDLQGIDLKREGRVRDWAPMLSAGRMLEPDDQYACVLEASVATEEHVGVGDYLLVWCGAQAEPKPTALKIVGVIERRRIARFHKGIALARLPVVQEICSKYTLVNSIDVVLAQPTVASMRRVGAAIRAVTRAEKLLVRSAEARLKRIQMAQDQQEAVLILLSCVAMLTALFIILSTLSMGMIERISQLGLLRCVGVTAGQLMVLTLAEVVPLGIIGVTLGVPIGLGLHALSVALVPEYLGTFTVSQWGIGLAVAAGLATALVGGLLPALAASTVTPLEATRPRARKAGRWTIWAAFAFAVTLLISQNLIVQYHVQRDLQFVRWSVLAVVLLYLVYALAAPLLVWVASRIAVPITAALVQVRLRLLQDQVGFAVWRSAGIVCGLMVGLSLIVGLVVFNRSFRSGWQFPKNFPEAYVWSLEQLDVDPHERLDGTPGVREFTATNAVNALVEERPLLVPESVLRSITWFMGIEPDEFLDMVQLEFVDGDEATARKLLKQGGYILVASDFAKTRRKAVQPGVDAQGQPVSNEVKVAFDSGWKTFKVAGVIDSPALDIAAGYFQVESESLVAAVGSVIGTNKDLERVFGVRGIRMVLLNFDLPDEAPPAGWPPKPGTPEAAGMDPKFFDTSLSLERRWHNYRETKVLQDVQWRLGATKSFYGTARELKDQIDTQLTRMTYLLTAVPAVALLVAAIGVANLMTANVSSRMRHLAIMRAVGATRGMILRMVVGEALVLGLLGSIMGLGLGLHLAWNVTIMTSRMWGYNIPFTVPWEFVGAAVVLTVGLCILAGVAPARHASRTNVIDALHVA